MSFRFIQTSDLHLGSPMTGSSLQLPAAKAEIRRRELREVLGRICALAADEQVDALLIPGDLFDDESAPLDDIGFAIEQFGRLGRPVVIAPGNHDYLSPASYYSPGFLNSRHGLRWPDNVVIFRQQAWQVLHIAGIEGVRIVGLAFETHVPISQRLLQRGIERAPDELSVLLFHGSRQRFRPPGKLETAPFDDAELIASGCDYAAIGHYHEQARIAAEGRIVGAYSGCPAGRGLDECGTKVVLKGEIGDDRRARLEPVRLDRRRIVPLTVDCSGALSNESIVQRIDEQLARSAAVAEDIVRVELMGTVPSDLTVTTPDRFKAERYFHLHVDASGLRPAYDLARFAEGAADAATTEGRFVRRLLRELQAAETAGDRERVGVVRQAIEYGLDALRGGRVRPRGLD
ncbi:MAG: metallophosphoesterase family protein [Dehalococcoidia bacterium]